MSSSRRWGKMKAMWDWRPSPEHRGTLTLALLGALSLTGCAGSYVFGGAAPSSENLYAGDAEGPPRAEAIPECDVARDSLSEATRRAWLLSEESLALPDPVRPLETDSVTISRWSGTELKAWMEEKSARAAAARVALNEAAESSHRERIIAGALLGVVFEDVARVLVTLPIPDDLRSEPELRETYREVLISNAQPYLYNADTAYAACRGNAQNSGLLLHWGRFCEHRREMLPGKSQEGPASGSTQVTIERQ